MILTGGSKKNLRHFMSKYVLLFFLKSFILSSFYLGLYLEFIFVYANREYSNFILITKKTCTPFSIVAVTGLPFYWQSRRAPFFPQFLQHLLFLQFWTVAVVNHVRKCLIVVLICIPLINSDVDIFSCDIFKRAWVKLTSSIGCLDACLFHIYTDVYVICWFFSL